MGEQYTLAADVIAVFKEKAGRLGFEACEAFDWAADIASPDLTFSALIDIYSEMIARGEAHEGWAVGLLELVWENITPADRLKLLDAIKGNGLKFLNRESFKRFTLTAEEEDLVRTVFLANRAVSALEAFDG
ncbi:MAG: hypothetical protein P8Y67_15170 [Alphaproteobacteria bacterium]